MGYDDIVGVKFKGKKRDILFYYYCKGNNLLYLSYFVEFFDLREFDWGFFIVRSVYSGIWMD